MQEVCPICEGAGLRLVERADGTRAAQPCVCRTARKAARMIEAARIPQRYAECTMDNYVPNYAGENPSLSAALVRARSFAREYPIDIYGKGLLFTGPNGTGKTHLAVGIVKELMAKGHQCLFVTYGELLTQVRNSYNPTVEETELEVLRPVFDVEVLIIDELGSSKPSDWVWDTVAHIINTRYNNMRSTIFTTNFANEREFLERDLSEVEVRMRDAWVALYKETLGDRIGERMRSRLFEMCIVTDMMGPDFRKSAPGRANIAKRKYRADELYLLAKTNEEQKVVESVVQLESTVRREKVLKAADKDGELKPKNELIVPRGATRIHSPALAADEWTPERLAREVDLATARRNARESSK